MKAGVAINPHTPISTLKSIIKDLDLVCVMSVNPGFGGQSFIESTYDKVKELKSLIKEQNSNAIIEIDGGVNSQNAKKLIDCGAKWVKQCFYVLLYLTMKPVMLTSFL